MILLLYLYPNKADNNPKQFKVQKSLIKYNKNYFNTIIYDIMNKKHDYEILIIKISINTKAKPIPASKQKFFNEGINMVKSRQNYDNLKKAKHLTFTTGIVCYKP